MVYLRIAKRFISLNRVITLYRDGLANKGVVECKIHGQDVRLRWVPADPVGMLIISRRNTSIAIGIPRYLIG